MKRPTQQQTKKEQPRRLVRCMDCKNEKVYEHHSCRNIDTGFYFLCTCDAGMLDGGKYEKMFRNKERECAKFQRK